MKLKINLKRKIMKKLNLTVALLVTWSMVFGHFVNEPEKGLSILNSNKSTEAEAKQKIQVALILDTSNSMDGLIDQAKTELWNIVNELAKAKKDSTDVEVKIAVYEYGNSSLSKQDGYLRKVLPFTSDLDDISEKLFELKTNGGEEYCGKVIKEALNELQWEDSDKALKIVYIAGNEPFTQGSVSYEKSCKAAVKRGVFVNTIHCGDEQVGINGHWALGATYGTGYYFAIDQDEKTYLVSTPYDDEITRLNNQLNLTYVPYGYGGTQYYHKQKLQDRNAMKYSKQNNVKRSISKSGRLYKNSSWDLVDAYENDKTVIIRVQKENLAHTLQTKTNAQLEEYVRLKLIERETIKRRIQELAVLREAYIRSQKMEKANSLGNSIIIALHKQAALRNFTFNANQ
jgi:hypothetical protein